HERSMREKWVRPQRYPTRLSLQRSMVLSRTTKRKRPPLRAASRRSNQCSPCTGHANVKLLFDSAAGGQRLLLLSRFGTVSETLVSHGGQHEERHGHEAAAQRTIDERDHVPARQQQRTDRKSGVQGKR